MSMLSRRSFRELRDNGQTQLRQVHLRASSWQESAAAADSDATIYIREDAVGVLQRTRASTMAVQVNDSLVELPVIESESDAIDAKRDTKPHHKRFVILNDERFPIVLDNHRTTNNARIRFVKITWPQQNAIEEDLEREKKARVYGLYFDTNSDSLRAESEQVLTDIGAMLREHADWRLRIEGHTDSLGGAAFNQDLALRRANTVRATLASKHGIDAARLDVSGVGDTKPVDSNETVEGRARNRRVELVRL
jgi:outer membrane protein OmpA-like peptidoglycan-associated protein